MKKTFLIIMSLLLVVTANAQEKKPLPEQASERAKSLKLVKEKQYKKKIKFFSEHIVVTEDEIIFLDQAGNEKKKKKLPKFSSVRLSKKGKLIGQQRYTDVTEKGWGGSEFILMDEDGNEIFKTNKVGDNFYLSPVNDGTVVQPICHEGGCTNSILFISKNNKEGRIVKLQVREPAQLKTEDISADGNYYISVYYKRSEKGNDYSSYLIFLDIEGNILWQKFFEEERIGRSRISSNGSFVAVDVRSALKKERYIHIYDTKGTLLFKKQVEYPGSYRFAVDNDERYIVAGSTGGAMYLFDTSTLSLLWQYSTGDKNVGFLDVDIDSAIVAAIVTTKNPKNRSDGSLPRYLYLFDIEGNIMEKKKFEGHGFGRWLKGPKVKITESGRKILIGIQDRLLEFNNVHSK